MTLAATEGHPCASPLAEILDGVDAPEWAAAAEVEPYAQIPEPARFHIEDTGQADWAMRKLVRVHDQLRDVDEMVARQLEPIERWRAEQTTALDRERLFWEALLIEFHRTRIEEDPEVKSIKLPHGELRSRKAPDSWSFDTEAFFKWARRHAPELIRTKEEIDKALAKSSLFVDDDLVPHLQQGGELVETEGVSITAGDRNFDVVVKGVGK
jgi:phage host-nuclease inhibitor protein Gam